jgi:uncharacterized membrane protein
LTRDFQVFQDIQKNAANRLVWFAAISGFALVNIHELARAISEAYLSTNQLIIVTIPWALAGLSAITTHWLLGGLIAKDSVYYLTKKHAAQTFLATLVKEPKLEDVLAIIDADKSDQQVAMRKKDVEKASPWVRGMEKLTFALLIVSFLWSVLYPIILNY